METHPLETGSLPMVSNRFTHVVGRLTDRLKYTYLNDVAIAAGEEGPLFTLLFAETERAYQLGKRNLPFTPDTYAVPAATEAYATAFLASVYAHGKSLAPKKERLLVPSGHTSSDSGRYRLNV